MSCYLSCQIKTNSNECLPLENSWISASAHGDQKSRITFACVLLVCKVVLAWSTVFDGCA